MCGVHKAHPIRKSWIAMVGDKIFSREEACYILQVSLNAGEEEVKRAYRHLVKQYHPDSNPNQNTHQVYLRIHAAYEYLQEHPYQAPIVMPARPVRIFETNAKTKAQHRQQQKFQEERKRALEREKEDREKKFQEMREAKQKPLQQTSEEEALNKIRAIWLAEMIKRQMEQDKKEKDAKVRKQVYQAFMQQKLNEEEELKSRK